MSYVDPLSRPDIFPAGFDPASPVRLGGVKISELIERFGTPLYLIDLDDFRSRAFSWAGR